MGNNIYYPSEGYLYISTDWHGDYLKFREWLDKIEIHKKERNISEANILILGDLVDPKDEKDIISNGDLKILNELDNFHKKTPNTLISVLMGNHERGLSILNEMRRHGQDTSIYEQSYTSLRRLEQDYFLKFSQLPVSAVTETGIVLTHAGLPNGGIESLFESLEEDVICMTEGCQEDFDPIAVQKKLDKLRMKYSISGHTPLRKFDPRYIQEGVAQTGPRRIIFTSNEGYEPGKRVGLCLNLEKEYQDILRDLKKDEDILYLD